MLSLFPVFFGYDWYVPFVFRLILAFFLLDIGLTALKLEHGWKRSIGLGSLVLSISLGLGAYAQLCGALSAMLALSLGATRNSWRKQRKEGGFYVLLFVVSLSLLFLGAGPFSLDLPL